jgi:serine/threonine protein kinase
MTIAADTDSASNGSGGSISGTATPFQAAELLGIARAGLSSDASPETMLWDDLDLDDPDDRRFGDYELLERIGRGGMGMVFRAKQLSLGREVAVKFIVGGLAGNARAVARFMAEARAAARLHHPHIVPVFEVGSVDGMHFFSMPLMRGETLAQRIAIARMTQADSVSLLLKLGVAVDYAHSLGLLHLDLKPGNILFDEHAQPLIGDFGLARHMDDAGGVDADDVSGTPAYMAPEQIDVGRHRLSRRTDVYALGAILCELLSGVAPHGHGDTRARTQRTSVGSGAAPGVLVPMADKAMIGGSAVDKDLEAICLKCLRVDPQQRYQNVAELNADLARYRDGNVVSVRNPPWHERAMRSLRRNPASTLATTAALAAMAFGLATTSWQWQRAEHERREANQEKALATAQASQMRQLAGLMAAAFPAGESARDERANSARNAVAWLKQHVSDDPSSQRAVLTSFRQALNAAHKGDVVAALVNEIVDQLGENYREQQVERLAKKGDRDSLIAAALIGIPRGVNGMSSAAHEAVLQRLFDDHADDPLALYAAALACHVQPQHCTHPQYYARLIAQFPDNAVDWVLVPAGAKPASLELASHVLHAAKAREFDDRLAPIFTLLRAALRDQQVPESILQPMQAVVEESEVSPSLRRNTVDNVPVPYYGDILQVCKPTSDAMHQVAGLVDACTTFGEKGMHSPNASLVSMMISVVIVRRLNKGTALDAEAKDYRRQYVWLDQHTWPKGPHNEAQNADRLQQDIAQYGEWEALKRQADRAGASRTPPPGWLPANPQLLLMSDERKPEAPHH